MNNGKMQTTYSMSSRTMTAAAKQMTMGLFTALADIIFYATVVVGGHVQELRPNPIFFMRSNMRDYRSGEEIIVMFRGLS